MIRRLSIAPEVFLALKAGVLLEVVAEPVPPEAIVVASGMMPGGRDFYLDIESPAFTNTDPLRPRLREHQCQLPESISQALNSGDGTYRP